jgi:hypothetical protein
MPVNELKGERDRSKPYGQQVTKEIVCDECDEVIVRFFMTGPRQSTDIAPARWVTRREQVASSRPGTYETYMCTPCVNELVPEENQAYNVTSRAERQGER